MSSHSQTDQLGKIIPNSTEIETTTPETSGDTSIPAESLETGTPLDIPDTTPPPVSNPVVLGADAGIGLPDPLEAVRRVFGPTWTPSVSPELVARGIYGFVRITGRPEVYSIGPQGQLETEESFAERSGSSEQEGVVGRISVEQASQLEIFTNPAGAPETENTQGAREAEETRDALIQEARDQADSLLGQGTREQEIRDELGFTENVQKLQEINLQIAQINQAFDTQWQSTEGRPVALGFIRGEQAQIRRQQAVEVGALASIAQALQGNIALAERTAKSTVELEFADRKQELQNTLDFLDLNREQFDRAEAKLAEERQTEVKAQLAEIEAEQAQRERVLEIARGIAGQVSNSVLNQILAAENEEDALRIANPFLNQPAPPSGVTTPPVDDGDVFTIETAYRNLSAQLVSTAIVNNNGSMRKGERILILDQGVDPIYLDQMWVALIEGSSLDEIRNELTKVMEEDGFDGFDSARHKALVTVDIFMAVLNEVKRGTEEEEKSGSPAITPRFSSGR